jgi:dissimilatory sulfite reductase (desulfoviridin) alpha/beta subunit
VTVEKEEDVGEIIDRTVYWIYRSAWSGRHLADQLDDIDFEVFRKKIREEFSAGT